MGLLKLINFLWLTITLGILFGLMVGTSDLHKIVNYKEHTKINLFIDRDFTNEEQEYITSAALQWSEASDHIIEYNVIRLPAEEKIDPENSIVISKVSPDYPQILLLDHSSHMRTLGYFNGHGEINSIYLVSDRLSDEYYEEVVLHELGHSLGLEHDSSEDGINTLMYPMIDLGSNHITKHDMKQFCYIYDCNVEKLTNYKK
jgi:hypothetical protein